MKINFLRMITFTLVLFMMGGLVFNAEGNASNRVVLASKPFTESYLLTEIMVLLLQHDTNLDIEYKNIEGGTTSILHPAILRGDIDIYPEYTGTAWQDVLKKENIVSDPQELFNLVQAEYEEQFQLNWLPPFGFNDTFTLAIKADLADKLNIKTYSDLAKVSNQLNFGAEPDFFERKDGFDNLAQTYGFDFKNTRQMAIALKYPAILSGEVDVINAFSTDGLLKRYDMVILQDDKNFFPSYLAAPIVRNALLEIHPEVGESLKKLAGLIDETLMIDMNYQVDEEKKDPQMVAREFLANQGLLE
ncbi:MAG TPA: glycine/betaine ABC transporter substrate-binding protein [Candidatus Atribacteria bacterium]|nr:glycine/betaine ABC transporter substrate-binding protein [Candidatus Atribacteria bacterium]